MPYGPYLDRYSHTIILGIPQSGKSTFAKKLVRKAKRVVFFDPHGDYEELGTVVRPAELSNPKLFEGRYCRIVVAAERDDNIDVADEFIYTQRQCRNAGEHGGLVLVADEVGDYKAKAERHLSALFRNGHKDGVCTVLVSQRATDIPLGCRSTATQVFSFRQESPQDLKWLDDSGWGEKFSESAKRWKAGEPPVTYIREPIYPR